MQIHFHGKDEWYTCTNSTFTLTLQHMSSVMRKLDYCLCENKGAGHLCGNCLCRTWPEEFERGKREIFEKCKKGKLPIHFKEILIFFFLKKVHFRRFFSNFTAHFLESP